MAAARLTGYPDSLPPTSRSGEESQPPPLSRAPVVAAPDRRTLEIRHFWPLPRGLAKGHPSDALRRLTRARGSSSLGPSPEPVPGHAAHSENQLRYALDAYFFFPPSFGVSEETWPRDDFYRDAEVFMRLHAPHIQLGQLADLESPQNPGALLRQQLPRLLDEHAPSPASLGALAQLFGAELADAATGAVQGLRARVQALARGARRSGPHPDAHGALDKLEHDLTRTCGDVLRALGSLRRLRAKTAAFQALSPRELLLGLSFAEEYACAIIDEQFAELATLIDGTPALRDGKGLATRLRARLGHTIEQVNRRRLSQGFATPWDEAPEYFAYRLNLLRDELERALYVDTRALARDPYYRNSAAMVAAGLAATWATLAQIPMLSGDLSSEHRLVVIGLAVGAYILKDRIKEWTRGVLSSRFLRWDHDRRVVGDALSRVGFGSFTGRARERLRYIADSAVPLDVMALRQKHRTVAGLTSEGEHVLLYQRRLTFESGASAVPEGFGVQEVLRISLDEVLRRLSDPIDPVSFYDFRAGQFKTAAVPKVYHLNLVLAATDLSRGEQIRVRTRVVLNQQGVVRISRVAFTEGAASTQTDDD